MSPPLTKPTTTSIFTSSKPPPPFCTFLFFLLLCILGFYTLHHPYFTPHHHPPNPQTTLRFRNHFLSLSSNSTVSTFLRALTRHPHLAGTQPSLDTAGYVYSHFQSLNLETYRVEYKSLLSYPVHASLTAHFSNGSAVTFSLTDVTGKDREDVVVPYHAYSPSGAAHAKVVFVNYGRDEDYRTLEALGVKASGCVVLARKGGGLSRGEVVRIAESKKALAVLLYADGDRIRGVERGTVMRGVGDPLSPGWPAVEGGERLGLEEGEVLERFPKIPSLPLSLENANVILGSLGGPLVPPEWRNSSRSRAGRVGPGPTMLNFTYQVW